MVFVALLRGINVGGHTAVSMAALKAEFESLGYTNVVTYINSGNVIFESRKKSPRAIESTLESMITKKFGHTIKVVVKNIKEINYIIDNIPKSWFVSDTLRCNVLFLHHRIDAPDIMDDLVAKPGIDEAYYVQGALLWATERKAITKSGMAKLTAHAGYKLMTIRNLNTTRKIHALMQQAGA